MAQADLGRVIRLIQDRYRAGSIDALIARDPAWWAAIGRAEAEVGELFQALCDADDTLARWDEAVSRLTRLWARVGADGIASERLDRVA
jgi:hypothetical protein